MEFFIVCTADGIYRVRPVASRRIGQDEAFAMRKRANRQAMPDGHPTEFGEDPPLPPSAIHQFTWTPLHANLIPSSHFYDEKGGDTVYAGPPVNKRGGMELDRSPAKQRRRGNDLRDYPRGAGSSAGHAARGRRGACSVTRRLGDDTIQREAGTLVRRLNIPEADDLLAEIAELIRARMASRDGSPVAGSAAARVRWSLMG